MQFGYQNWRRNLRRVQISVLSVASGVLEQDIWLSQKKAWSRAVGMTFIEACSAIGLLPFYLRNDGKAAARFLFNNIGKGVRAFPHHAWKDSMSRPESMIFGQRENVACHFDERFCEAPVPHHHASGIPVTGHPLEHHLLKMMHETIMVHRKDDISSLSL